MPLCRSFPPGTDAVHGLCAQTQPSWCGQCVTGSVCSPCMGGACFASMQSMVACCRNASAGTICPTHGWALSLCVLRFTAFASDDIFPPRLAGYSLKLTRSTATNRTRRWRLWLSRSTDCGVRKPVRRYWHEFRLQLMRSASSPYQTLVGHKLLTQ